VTDAEIVSKLAFRTICVTQEHIDRGQRADCDRCPIALAVLDALGNPEGSSFIQVSLWNVFAGRDTVFRLPGAAREFISDFDNRRNVRPFRFTLSVALTEATA